MGGTGHELLGEVVEIVKPCKYQVGDRLLAMSAAYMKWVIGDEFERQSGLKDLCFLQEFSLLPAAHSPQPTI